QPGWRQDAPARSTPCSTGWSPGSTAWRRSSSAGQRCRRRDAPSVPMRAPEFWHEPPGLVAGLLTPFGIAFDAASRLRRAVARPYRAPVPVICVGNLVAGGSGKTPVVLALARILAASSIAVHIVSRGYGGRLSGPLRVDPAAHDAAAVGDEAVLLAGRAPA